MDESIRVLHVDSTTDSDCSALVSALEEDGFVVERVTGPSSGLDRLRNDTYDCVISAAEFDEMTGVDFCACAQETADEVPVILAWNPGEQPASEAIAAGATDLVPPSCDSIVEQIETAVGDPEQQRVDRCRWFEAIVESVPSAILCVDRSGEITVANERARSLLGVDEGSIQRRIDDPAWEARDLDGNEIESADHPVRRVLDSGKPVADVRLSLRRPDGSRQLVDISAVPLFDGDSERERVVVALTDATPRDRRETAFEALHDIATTIQREETVEAVCERTVTAAADILDFDTCSTMIREDAELVPYAVSENTPPDGVRRMQIDEGLAGKTYQTQESEVIEYVPDNDDVKPASETYRSGISVPIGEYGVFQAVSTEPEAFTEADIDFAELLLSHTESKIEQLEREAALRRQNERLDEFAGIVSHDLSNPLNVAELQLELVRESVDDERLDAVSRAHDRMGTLIDELLTLARNREPIEETEPVDLATVAAQSLDTLDTDAITLETDTDATIQADRGMVQILLENLLKNSADHGAADDAETGGSQVTVRIGLLENGFFIEDDGPGVPEDLRKEIFDVGVSTAAEGSGIGLKIVTEIVEAHGWEIDVTESDTGGARFEITGVSIERTA